MDSKKILVTSYTNEEERLLTNIVEKGSRQLVPVVGKNGIIYEDIEDIKGELNWSEVKQLLESLAEKGALLIKKAHFALFCPKCNSANVLTKYICPRCRGDNVNQVKLIEHSLCGYTGVFQEFQTGDQLICPNCKAIITEKNGKSPRNELIEDYRVIGISFNCENCDTRFDRPAMNHICQNCSRVFDYRSGVYGKYHEFEVPEKTILSVRRGLDIKVLLVEDNPDEAMIILKTLKENGKVFTVEHVELGSTAIEKIKTSHYDLILLDYLLPDFNGLDILHQINKQNIETPVIMFTGADEREIAVEAMKLGASDYLIKSSQLYKKLPEIILQMIKR